MKLVILMPAYNEASVIGTVLGQLPKSLPGLKTIERLVVDDGSTDATQQVAKNFGALVLHHRLNRGVGLATMTGMKAALLLSADLLVTLDSDGQHDPADIERVIEPIIQGRADLVVGTRLKETGSMPFIRRLGNQAMNLMLQALANVKTTDSQSGFRAYNRWALQRLNITTSGYEVCTEILVAAQEARLRIAEVPIRVIYTDYSKQKGQSVTNAINIVFRLVAKFILG